MARPRRLRRRSVECSQREHGQSNIQVSRISVPVKFLKSVCRSNMEEKKMRLPSQLVRNVGSELASGVAILGFRSGFYMRVRLSEDKGKVWLSIAKLVQHFHIREGFILEFTYKGFANFELSVFDPSSNYFQIEYPCNDASSSSGEEHSCSKQCSLHHNDAESDINSVENNGCPIHYPFEDGLSSRKKASMSKKNLPKHSTSAGLRTNKNRKNDASPTERPVLKRKRYDRKSKTHLKEEVVDLSVEGERSSKLKKNETAGATNKRSRTNIKEVKSISSQKLQCMFNKLSNKTKRALDAANKFKHQNPSFKNIPSKFSKRYMNKVPKQITLVAPDRTEWLVRIRVTTLGYLSFGIGWRNFSKHNHMKEGDVCLFELIRSKHFTFKVSVFYN